MVTVKGRKEIRVIESQPFSEILFIIASGKNYALSIADSRGKEDSSSTNKQLQELEERGFLKSNKEKLLNKTVYSINWNKINGEFCTVLSETIKDRIYIAETFFPEHKEYIKGLKEMELDKREFSKNIVLKNIFQNAFANWGLINLSELTIKTVFIEFCVILSTAEGFDKIYDIFSNDKEDYNFLEGLRNIILQVYYEPLTFAVFTNKVEQNGFKVAKSIVNRKNMSENTTKNITLSSEIKVKDRSK